MPSKPWACPRGAATSKPTPLSWTDTLTLPFADPTLTCTAVARAYLLMLVSASCTRR